MDFSGNKQYLTIFKIRENLYKSVLSVSQIRRKWDTDNTDSSGNTDFHGFFKKIL